MLTDITFEDNIPTIVRGVRACCNTGECPSDSQHERDLKFDAGGRCSAG
jgi:hypothetical protein